MMLYGCVHETPDAEHPYLAVITDADGIVMATAPVRSRREADDKIQEAKLRLLRLLIERRCRKWRAH